MKSTAAYGGLRRRLGALTSARITEGMGRIAQKAPGSAYETSVFTQMFPPAAAAAAAPGRPQISALL